MTLLSHRHRQKANFDRAESDMEMVSTFLALCQGVHFTGDWFPIQIASYVDLGLFFGLRLYQCLNKPSCYHWFEMPWSPCDMTVSPKPQCSCSMIANMVHINAILSKIIVPNSQYCFYADRVSFDVNAVTLMRGIKTHWACPWIQNLYFLERLKTFYFFNFTR